MKNFAKFALCLTFATVLFAGIAKAEPGDDPGPVPVDGGVSILLAAGAAYGAKKIYDMRKKTN